MTTSHLLVSEIFGPTFQGEGPDIGKPTFFLRLGGCPVRCTWCDTKYTWDTTQFDLSRELQSMTIGRVSDELCKLVGKYGIDRLVISGGEPLVQQKSLAELFGAQTLFSQIEVETSGVIDPNLHLSCGVTYNVSPKLKHAGAVRTFSSDVLRKFVRLNARFKFVVESIADLEEVADIVNTCDIPNDRVWVMSLGTERHELVARTQEIAEQVVLNRWNLTTRLHVLVYGNKRGV